MNVQISVIVPVYNTEKYLHRCVDSILSQTFKDFELLLIDDGSTDKSGEICDEYAQKDERVKVWHKENGGVSSARNIGLDAAKGEWVTFSDSDDKLEEDWLSTFSKNMNGYDAVVSGFNILTRNGTRPVAMKIHSENPVLVADYLNRNHIFGFLWCKCFQRSLIEKNRLRFNEKLFFLEDEDFVLRYWAESNKVKIVPRTTYNYYFPNYDNKYGYIDCFDVYFSMLTTAISFINCKHSNSLIRYALGCHRCMLHSYQRHHYKEAFTKLKMIASIRRKTNLLLRMRFINSYTYLFWHLFMIAYTLKTKK